MHLCRNLCVGLLFIITMYCVVIEQPIFANGINIVTYHIIQASVQMNVGVVVQSTCTSKFVFVLPKNNLASPTSWLLRACYCRSYVRKQVTK